MIELQQVPGEGIAITHANAMQIIELERDDWNFHCPATGRLVFSENGEPNTPALRGSWCHEVPEEPMHLADELQPLWQAHLEAQAAADEGADVVGFLGSVERPNWVAFEITTCGLACGPVWSTAWTVLDLGGASCIGEETGALANEEFLFPTAQSYSVRPGQADAMTCRKGADYTATSIDRSLNQIAGVLPMHQHPLVEGPYDLR